MLGAGLHRCSRPSSLASRTRTSPLPHVVCTTAPPPSRASLPARHCSSSASSSGFETSLARRAAASELARGGEAHLHAAAPARPQHAVAELACGTEARGMAWSTDHLRLAGIAQRSAATSAIAQGTAQSPPKESEFRARACAPASCDPN
jgi:hypothetical protein